jgi:hypothetical protein
VKSLRSFDPRVVGELECAAWVAYYRREWPAFVRAGIALSRRILDLSWPATIRCSWLVLRANQLWAPFPENRPDRAQHAMECFYRIVQRRYGESFDPAMAAQLEVQWWRVHRDNQHSETGGDDRALAAALAGLYAHVYQVPERSVRGAAEQRALAMCHSDAWVREGCEPDSLLIERERDLLIDSYAALLEAVNTGAPRALPSP